MIPSKKKRQKKKTKQCTKPAPEHGRQEKNGYSSKLQVVFLSSHDEGVGQTQSVLPRMQMKYRIPKLCCY